MEHHPAAGVARVSRRAASRLLLFNRGSWKITQGNQHIPDPSHHFSRWWFSFLLRWDMDDRSRKMVPYASLSRISLLFVVVIVNCHHRSAVGCLALFSRVFSLSWTLSLQSWRVHGWPSRAKCLAPQQPPFERDGESSSPLGHFVGRQASFHKRFWTISMAFAEEVEEGARK